MSLNGANEGLKCRIEDNRERSFQKLKCLNSIFMVRATAGMNFSLQQTFLAYNENIKHFYI